MTAPLISEREHRIRDEIIRALAEFLRAYLDTSRPFEGTVVSGAIADRAVKALIASETAAELTEQLKPATVGIGPSDTQIIVDALDWFSATVPIAPHEDIKRIRDALTGTVVS